MQGLVLIYANKKGTRYQTGDMPLREPMMTQCTDAYLVHQAWIVYNPFYLKLFFYLVTCVIPIQYKVVSM